MTAPLRDEGRTIAIQESRNDKLGTDNHQSNFPFGLLIQTSQYSKRIHAPTRTPRCSFLRIEPIT